MSECLITNDSDNINNDDSLVNSSENIEKKHDIVCKSQFEFIEKNEKIEDLLNNLFCAHLPLLYESINSGKSCDTVIHDFYRYMESQTLQIEDSPEFIQNPNILIDFATSDSCNTETIDQNESNIFGSYIFKFSFKGNIQNFNFMNFSNIFEESSKIKCITAINLSEKLVIETIIGEEYVLYFINCIKDRIGRENSKILKQYSFFVKEKIYFINKEFEKYRMICNHLHNNNFFM